jgi:hypothetical protein
VIAVGLALATLAVAAWMAPRLHAVARAVLGLLLLVAGGLRLAVELGAWPGGLLAGAVVCAAASVAVLVRPLAPRALWGGFAVVALTAVVAVIRG